MKWPWDHSLFQGLLVVVSICFVVGEACFERERLCRDKTTKEQSHRHPHHHSLLCILRVCSHIYMLLSAYRDMANLFLFTAFVS